MLRNSRGTALPCFDEHLPAGILSPDYAVVLHGEPSTGKSVLLRNILATHLLPKACDGHGLPSVLVDADNAFDVWLLAKLLQDRARRSGVNSEEAVDLVTDALGRLLVFRPCEPLDLLQQLRQLRSIFSSNPTAGLLVIDSMSAWQSMTAAFPRSAGATLKECWRAVARLQQEASVAAVIAHRDAAVEFPLHFEAIHLGVGCCPKVQPKGEEHLEASAHSEHECFYIAPGGKVLDSSALDAQTFFVISPAGEVVTIPTQPELRPLSLSVGHNHF